MRYLAAILGVCLIGAMVCARAAEPPPKAPELQPKAAEPQPTPADAHAAWDGVRDQVVRLLDALDDNHYQRRQQAVLELKKFLDRPELAGPLAAEFQRRLERTDTSFEVRAQLTEWLDKLPTLSQPAKNLTPADLERLVAQLDDDTYTVRAAAIDRLNDVPSNPELVWPLLELYKRLLADPSVSYQKRQAIVTLYDDARWAWLNSDPATWKLPKVSDEQLGRWVDQLSAPPAQEANGVWPTYEMAKRELMDLIMHDEEVPRVKTVLAARLADPRLDDSAVARIKSILEWTRPALMAEIWKDRELVTLQPIVIGEPQQPAGMPRATLFDRADDKTAHCVSGNSLAAGDYPIDIAFPRTNSHSVTREPIMFHLVNLPSPRRQMLYEPFANRYDAKQVDSTELAARLSKISARSLDRMLTDKRLFTPCDVEMLLQLDAQLVSKFAVNYFKAVDDRECPASDPPGGRLWAPKAEQSLAGTNSSRPQTEGGVVQEGGGPKHLDPNDPQQPRPAEEETPGFNIFSAVDPRIIAAGAASQHGLICAVLASDGTSDAGPGLLEAIRDKRFLPPTEEAPYQLPLIAALSIANRDPWPEAEAWLASLVERTDLLVDIPMAKPEVGAVAAAILIQHRHADLVDFGLRQFSDPLFAGAGCPCVRFESPERRQAFLQWWAKQSANKAL